MSSSEAREPIEQLAEEFVERWRRGEQPSIAEYLDRRPDLAEQIQRLFPTLLLMEQLGAAGPASSTRSVPTSLTRLGEYRILREIGRGGMGVVFEAVQESLGRHVALKVLPPALCRDKYLERFQREAKAAARLHHTNIVPVFGVGSDAGMHFYVMQFIAGRGLDRVLDEVRGLRQDSTCSRPVDSPLSSLAQSLLSGRFSPEAGPLEDQDVSRTAILVQPQEAARSAGDPYFRTVARLGLQAAQALHHAHSQGVLHRDVKPSNLLLDAAGMVWVADFGLAKADDAEDLTDTGDLIGTLRYMAPERLQGRCDARSDVYGLGSTLYELLALRPAFDAPGRLRLMDQVAHGTAPRLRHLVPGLPRDLEMVVTKAMAREPGDRYLTAQELADDLDRFLSDRPVQARRIAFVERLGRWCRRHPAVAALSAAVVFLMLASGLAGWWAAGRLRQEVAAVQFAQRNTARRLNEARQAVWDARLAQARAGRASRLPGQRFKSLEALAEAARIQPSRELRNEAAACLALTDIRTQDEWDADLQTDRLTYSTGVAFDPTLEHHAATLADGSIVIHATATNLLVKRLQGSGDPADFIRFSPDGRYLLARYNSTSVSCRVWNWRTGELVLERSLPGAVSLTMDFLPDSALLVLGSANQLESIALPSGQTVTTVRLDITPGWVAVDGGMADLVAISAQTGAKLRVVERRTGKVVASWDRLPAELVAVAWQPGCSRFAASGRDGNLYLFELDSRIPPTSLRGHLLEARELAFTPDGNLLVSRGWDGTTRFWDTVGGLEILRVRGASFLGFDREGRRLAYRGYNSRRLGIWELAERTICRVLSNRSQIPQGHAGVSFSPDSRLLAVATSAGVTLWDPFEGTERGFFGLGPTTDLLFDPAGRFLYMTGNKGTRIAKLTRIEHDGNILWQIPPPVPWIGPLWPNNGFQMACDRAGNRIAVVARFRQVTIVPPPGQSGATVALTGHPQVSSVAISPDGRFAATGTWRGAGVMVWNAQTGTLVQSLPTMESAGVGFTLDGKQLLVLESEGTYRAYRVGSWEKLWERSTPETGFTRGLRAALHPGGRIMAHVSDRVNLRLVDLQSGTELAVLPVPESQNLAAYEFSPDGRFLAAVTVRGVVQLWDLERLRAVLRDMELDWELPDKPDNLVRSSADGMPGTLQARLDQAP